MVGHNKCYVPQCSGSTTIRHRFPNPTLDIDRFKIWIKAIHNVELMEKDPQSVYRNKRVCNLHFESKYVGPSKLFLNAVPTLNLPGASSIEPNILGDILSAAEGTPNPTLVFSGASSINETNMDNIPSTAQVSPNQSTIVENSHNIGNDSKSSFSNSVAGCSSQRTPLQVLQEAGVDKICITPRKKKLYDALKKLRKTYTFEKNKVKSFRRRLFEAKKFHRNYFTDNLQELNSMASMLINCQLRQYKKSKNLRRFRESKKIAMDEDPSSKEALRIAIRILRERCNTFQKRIAVLEGDNAKLKSELQKYDPNECSLTEIDSLKQRIANAEEQNGFLLNKMKIVSQENLQLWSNLGKLTHANKSLGSHLNKINDSLSQHVNNHQPLIRSKTFTQERPTVYDSSEKVNGKEEKMLELEDVSLKLISNLTDVQNEVDSLASLSEDFKNVGILDNIITSSLGFKSDNDDKCNDFTEELKVVLEELNFARDESQRQNNILRETLQCLKTFKESQGSFENKNDTNLVAVSKMCPICSQQFPEEMDFSAFVNHVESHFISQDDGNL